MDRYALGADVGGTSVKLGLFTAQGALVEKWSIPTDTAGGGGRVLPDTAASLRAHLAGRGIAPEQIVGLGVGVPGPVDARGTVHGAANLGWGAVDVAARLGELLPGFGRIAVANDANAAALGELRFGGGKGYESAVTVTLGTGVGGGVVLSGGILPGAHGAAGELGHMTVDPDETEACACGKRGCLEQYASANGLVRVARRLLTGTDTPCPLRDAESFTSQDVCTLAAQGDKVCAAALDRCAEAIGRALSLVSAVLDPEVYILGGGLSQAGDVLFTPVRAWFDQYAFHVCRKTPILPALLGSDAGIFGCAAMVL